MYIRINTGLAVIIYHSNQCCGSGSADPHREKRIRIQLLDLLFILKNILKSPFILAAFYATRIRFLRHDRDPAK